MCYHISFEVKLESILDYFPDLVIDTQTEMNFTTAAYMNGFDHPPVKCIAKSRKDGKLHLVEMMWGFLPANVKDFEAAKRFWNGYKDENGRWNTGFITLNCIGEEMLQKPLYRDAALSRRCIFFMDGFYEWQHVFPMGKKGQRLKTAVKYPHHIYLKDNPYPFTMCAGIWNPWKHTETDTETGEMITTVTPTVALCTTKANSLMARIHNSKLRMPTFLTKELADE
ncbi:MAG: SOS response-associated peptidase [Bacteroidota bacterium]|nr:SOS response-associated peptidase [Bacteroidota bacterium]